MQKIAVIKQDSFKQQVLGYKSQGDVGRVVASLKSTKPKEQAKIKRAMAKRPPAQLAKEEAPASAAVAE